jgi:hypothetical protein
MLSCIIILNALLYDIDTVRSFFKTTGYHSPSHVTPAADITQTVAYKKE